MWINSLLDIEFKGREIIVKQLEDAKYELTNGEGYISIKFSINKTKEKFPFKVRVPVEMKAYQLNRHPIMFLLHIQDGIVDELEIYTADGSLIDDEISVDDSEHKTADILKPDY